MTKVTSNEEMGFIEVQVNCIENEKKRRRNEIIIWNLREQKTTTFQEIKIT